jgi:hypothetical protein
VYLSRDLGASWSRIDPPGEALGLATAALAGDRRQPGLLYLGSHGRGVFRLARPVAAAASPPALPTATDGHGCGSGLGLVLGLALLPVLRIARSRPCSASF